MKELKRSEQGFDFTMERKRSRVVLSDSDSSDELGEPIRRKVSKFVNTNEPALEPSDHFRRKVSKFSTSSELGESAGRKVSKFGKNEANGRGDEFAGRKVSKFDEKRSTGRVLGMKSGRSLMEDDGLDLRLSLSNGHDEEDVDENVGVPRKIGSLKVLVNKHKPVGNGQVNESKEGLGKSGLFERKKVKLDRGVSERRDANKKSVDLSGLKHSKKKVVSGSSKKVEVKLKKRTVVESGKEMDESNVDAQRSKVEVEKKEGNAKSGTKQVGLVKGKETKIKGASCTEKQLLREKIKKMLFAAGWTIDYRPRRGRDYLDSVYMSPSGTGYWSITKAYEALQKEEKNSSKDGKGFTPLPNEILSKLTRQTRRKEEKVSVKNKKREGDSSKSKKAKVKVLKDVRKVSENKLKEVSQDSGDERPLKNDTPKKSVRANSHIVDERKHRALGRLALLVRGYDNGSNSEDNELAYSGKRTLISWLIDSGMISVGEKVEYMNLRKRRVMEEGYITEDGIQCGCCSKIITISRFELHAGSKLGQPFQNIYVKSGKSLLQCQIDAWNKQKESERKGFHAVDVEGDDPNDDTCGLCGDGGDLICCDGCPSTFHLNCLDMQMLPQGDWHCPNCVCKHCEKVGRYSTKSGVRTKSPLRTCRLCVKKYHKSCSSEIQDTPVTSNDPNFSFCGQNCREEKKEGTFG